MQPYTSRAAALAVLAALYLAPDTASAQFLKKLKDKAASAITDVAAKKATGGGAETAGDAPVAETGKPTETPVALPSGGAAKAGNTAKMAYATTSFALEQGEYIVTGEFKLTADNTGTHAKVITRKSGKYYLYTDGQRSGPYDRPPIDMLGGWKREAYADEEEEKRGTQKEMAPNSNLVVDGKSYGTYMGVISYYHAPKTKEFYAIGIKVDGKGTMTCDFITDKKTTRLPGMSINMIISPNDQLAAAQVMKTAYFAKTDAERSSTKMDEDAYFILSNGKNAGPFPYDPSSQYSMDDQGNITQRTQNAINVNGKLKINSESSISRNGKMFVRSDGASGVWVSGGSALFSDGTTVSQNVLQPTLVKEGGSEALCWMSVDNQAVYVCKKAL